MGMKSVRMSRKYHAMPVMDVKQVDISGLRGIDTRDDSVLRDAHDPPSAPIKHRPFAVYPMTPAPRAAEEDGKPEGRIRGRQADKSK